MAVNTSSHGKKLLDSKKKKKKETVQKDTKMIDVLEKRGQVDPGLDPDSPTCNADHHSGMLVL